MTLWIDGVRRVPAWQDGGSMLGGPKRVIWHSTENDPDRTSAYTIAEYLNRVGYQVHVIWNPVSGEIVQMIPADRAGRGLRNLAGGIETNRAGDVCVQIEVVARASKPFTCYPMEGLDRIMGLVRGLGVPDVWPGGPPPRAPLTAHVSPAVWNTQAGHYSHSQIPENDHNDPGAIDIRALFGDTISADEVWKFNVPAPWDKKDPNWQADTVLSNTAVHVRSLEDQVTALSKQVDLILKKLSA